MTQVKLIIFYKTEEEFVRDERYSEIINEN